MAGAYFTIVIFYLFLFYVRQRKFTSQAAAFLRCTMTKTTITEQKTPTICIKLTMSTDCEGGPVFYQGLTLASFEYHWAHLYFLSSFGLLASASYIYKYKCINDSSPNAYQLPHLNLSVCGAWSVEKGELTAHS